MAHAHKYDKDREEINAHARRMSTHRMIDAIGEMFKTEVVASDEEARVLTQIQERLLAEKDVVKTSVH